MTLNEIRELLATIGDLYPHAKFSPKADETWHKYLGTYPAAAVLPVLDKLMTANPVYPPTAPMIRAELLATTEPGLSAQEAWETVLRAGVRCAANDPGCVYEYVADPRIADAVRAIGWYRIATADYQDHGTLYAQFRDAYSVVAERHDRAALRESTPALSGMSNLSQIESGSDPWPGPLPMIKPVAGGWQKAGQS